jgi:hypothetical protein
VWSQNRRRLLSKSGGGAGRAATKQDIEEQVEAVVGTGALSSREAEEVYLQSRRVALFDSSFLALMMVLAPGALVVFGYPLLRLLFRCFCPCCCCRDRAEGYNPSPETLWMTFSNVFLYLEAMAMNTMLLGMSAITIAILKTSESHPTNVITLAICMLLIFPIGWTGFLMHILFNHLGSPDMFEEEEEPVNHCKICTLSCLGCITFIVCCGQNRTVAVEEQDPDEEGKVMVVLTLPTSLASLRRSCLSKKDGA